MRIIGGQFRGRKIEYPLKSNVRPTKDRIREAVFNVLSDKLLLARVLDLFAGSGGFGLEAISRGADKAVFVDNDVDCCGIIERNVEKLDIKHKITIHNQDVFTTLSTFNEKDRKFDLIFADPPYNKGLAKKALIMINQYDILIPSGIIIIEHSVEESLPDKEGKLSFFKQKTYKDINISYYQVR